ncbi:DUF2958 domain-containing protein [Cupriavidus sp. IDO]|uniref:DUF2958 domain-containing protein n=1 Tax=Cupriavidus sp. IDO TaxID=1539142 RepID=UPI0006922759|nr:DUF2958 domain-containing protein [Cupriavidus sp. IDO]KWR91485.1 hypothetical protein RM96_03815 [Cupriavidus sp. IDO]
MYPTLITEEQRARLLANGHSGHAGDLPPVVRLFTPDAHATWLLAALDPADGDTAYGLVRSPTDRTGWPALLCRPESQQTIVSYDRPRLAEPSRTLRAVLVMADIYSL